MEAIKSDDIDGKDWVLQDIIQMKEEQPLSYQIREARKESGLSQREFAQEIGITQAQLCRLESKNNSCRPARKTLKKLAPYLGKSYSDLLVQVGYNGIVPLEDEYYGKSGEAIDVKGIIKEIYAVDPELICCLEDFKTYGTEENCQVIKAIIKAMKLSENGEGKELEVFKTSFKYLKEYILNILQMKNIAKEY